MADALRTPTAEIGRLENALSDARAQLEQVLAEKASTVQQTERAERDAREARTASERYAMSASWRITAPLRVIANLRLRRKRHPLPRRGLR
jgi:hypothetical protein